MAKKNDVILNLSECAREFRVSPATVKHYLDAGDLFHWTSGEGAGLAYHIPLSRAEPVLGPHRTALTPEQCLRESGGWMTKGVVYDRISRGQLTVLKPTKLQADRMSIYVTRASFDALMAARHAKEQPPLKLVPTAPEQPQTQSATLPPDVASQAQRMAEEQRVLRLLDDRTQRVVVQVTKAINAAAESSYARHEELVTCVSILSKQIEDISKKLGDLTAALELRLGEPLRPTSPAA